MNRFFGRTLAAVERVSRSPVLSDDELAPLFAEVARGYDYRQAAERCGLDPRRVLDTLYSDDDICQHVLKLSMKAGALIRAGQLPIPDRHDGLYEE